MHHSANDNRDPVGECSRFGHDRKIGNAAPSRLPVLPRRLVALAIIGWALVSVGDNAAQAQVSVDGRPGAVHIEVHEATLREVFDALQTKFGLSYRTDDALETRKTGVFDGPLPRVTARILEGYDFAMKVTPQGIDVLVLRQNQVDGQIVALATPVPMPSRGPPAPVMSAAQANRYEREHFR